MHAYLGKVLELRQVLQLESKIKNDVFNENDWIKYTAKKLGSTAWCCISEFLQYIIELK